MRANGGGGRSRGPTGPRLHCAARRPPAAGAAAQRSGRGGSDRGCGGRGRRRLPPARPSRDLCLRACPRGNSARFGPQRGRGLGRQAQGPAAPHGESPLFSARNPSPGRSPLAAAPWGPLGICTRRCSPRCAGHRSANTLAWTPATAAAGRGRGGAPGGRPRAHSPALGGPTPPFTEPRL